MNEDQILIREPTHYLTAYADASYGGNEGNLRRSQSGYVLMMLGAAVSWSSQKQRTKSATSSTDAELYALQKAIKEVLWSHELLKEIGLHGPESILIFQDNRSTITIAENPVHRGRLRHMAIIQQFINDTVEDRECKLVWCPEVDMIADILTKPLAPPRHARLTTLLGLSPLSKVKAEMTPETRLS
jgi:hypothetical protein